MYQTDLYSRGYSPSTKKREFRNITKAVTRSAFCHIGDAFAIGKLKVWVGRYKKGEGMDDHQAAFLDVDTARVVFSDLFQWGELPERMYDDGKLELFGGSEKDGKIEARILRFRMDREKNAPVVIEVSTGPGKRTATGGFAPAGALQTCSIYLDRMAARKLAGAVLADRAFKAAKAA